MIFKKSGGVDVLDFTRLQKKGILKVPEKSEQSVKVNAQGYVDLGVSVLPKSEPMQEPVPSYSSANPNESVSALGFLDSLASSNGTSSSEQPNYFGSSGSSELELQGLKNKIEDLEYKIRVLEDKIAKLEGI